MVSVTKLESLLKHPGRLLTRIPLQQRGVYREWIHQRIHRIMLWPQNAFLLASLRGAREFSLFSSMTAYSLTYPKAIWAFCVGYRECSRTGGTKESFPVARLTRNLMAA